jgi:hypothetical protein
MSAADTPRLTVTVRTRLGQVLDRELEPEEAAEIHEALLQMITVLFQVETPEQVRSVTFDIVRQ